MPGNRALQCAILLAVFALVIIGVVVQGSISSVTGDAFDRNQIKWLGVSLVAASVCLFIPYHLLIRRAGLIYGAGLILLLLVPFIGATLNGGKRWLAFGSFSVQPAELMKFAIVLVLAKHLRFRRDFGNFSSLLVPGALVAIPVILIFGQPDLGTALLFIPVALAMLFTAGAEHRHLFGILMAGVLVAVFGFTLLLESYQQERILSTVMRDRLTKAERAREGYQLEQSIRSIAIGGIAGQGISQGIQNRMNMLPYRHNDFIFAVIAEELGFLGCLVIFGLVTALVFLIFRIAFTSRDPAGRLLCVGMGTLYGTQSLVHIGVNLGLVPTTGMTLPFVSSGGTALLTFTVAMALVANVAGAPLRMTGAHSIREQLERLEHLLRRRRLRSRPGGNRIPSTRT